VPHKEDKSYLQQQLDFRPLCSWFEISLTIMPSNTWVFFLFVVYNKDRKRTIMPRLSFPSFSINRTSPSAGLAKTQKNIPAGLGFLWVSCGFPVGFFGF
jgi:hypothetical protein